jgi:hypothetical protein
VHVAENSKNVSEVCLAHGAKNPLLLLAAEATELDMAPLRTMVSGRVLDAPVEVVGATPLRDPDLLPVPSRTLGAIGPAEPVLVAETATAADGEPPTALFEGKFPNNWHERRSVKDFFHSRCSATTIRQATKFCFTFIG